MSLLAKLGVASLAVGVGSLATLTQVQGRMMEVPALAELTSLLATGPSVTGTTGPIDQTYTVRRVRIDALVADLELITVPQAGPVRVQASGKVDTLKELSVRSVGDEVIIRLDSDEEEAWFPWNLFNMWSRDRKAQDLRVRITAPVGTPYDIEDMIGSINAGDLDAPLRLEGHALNARFGRVQSARVSIAGRGRINVGAIKETLDLVVAGSGDIRVARINGPFDVDIAGSGGVVVDSGQASAFSVTIAGSGDVLFKGHAVNPKIEIMGSGSITVGSYSGALSQDIAGSGEFKVLSQGQPGPQPPAPPQPPAAPPKF